MPSGPRCCNGWPAPSYVTGTGFLHALCEQFDAVPDNGIGHGLPRYLCPDPVVRHRLADGIEPQVSFNYMGDFSFAEASRHTSMFGVCDQPFGPAQAKEGVWPYLIDIVPSVIRHRLRMDVNYSANLHRESTVREFVTRIVDLLDRIPR